MLQQAKEHLGIARRVVTEGTKNALECARVANVKKCKGMRRNVVGGKVCEGGRNEGGVNEM